MSSSLRFLEECAPFKWFSLHFWYLCEFSTTSLRSTFCRYFSGTGHDDRFPPKGEEMRTMTFTAECWLMLRAERESAFLDSIQLRELLDIRSARYNCDNFTQIRKCPLFFFVFTSNLWNKSESNWEHDQLWNRKR